MLMSKRLKVSFTPSEIRNQSNPSSFIFSKKVELRKILEITMWLQELYEAYALWQVIEEGLTLRRSMLSPPSICLASQLLLKNFMDGCSVRKLSRQ